MIRATIFDLDGVVRHFDPDYVGFIEVQYGLERGALNGAAFEPRLLEQVVTGRISRADWIQRIGIQVGVPPAADAWGRQPSHVDPAMIRIIDRLRQRGTTVAILTNGTGTIPRELTDLDLVRHVDHVFNSAEIGHAKPSRFTFRYVLDALSMQPSATFFTDDSAEKVEGAALVGMHTHLFRNAPALSSELERLGLL